VAKSQSEVLAEMPPLKAEEQEEVKHEHSPPSQAARPQTSLQQKMMHDYCYSGREKKVCKKCGESNPFFKNECSQCKFKFPKT